jgi:hypothetical protein
MGGEKEGERSKRDIHACTCRYVHFVSSRLLQMKILPIVSCPSIPATMIPDYGKI